MSVSIAFSRPVQRFAAIGLAAAVLLGIANLIALPIADHIEDLGRRIAATQLQLAAMKRVEAAAATLGAEQGGTRAGTSAPFLSGETEALQQASLQADLKTLAAESGIRILSTSSVAVSPRNGFQLTGAQLALRAPMGPLHDFLSRIEAHQPPTLIDMIELHPVPDGETGTNARLLDVQIRVLGVLRREVRQP